MQVSCSTYCDGPVKRNHMLLTYLGRDLKLTDNTDKK
jgi:hypothetical protein